MKRIIVIILGLSFALVAKANQEEQWEVRFSWASGWGSSPTMIIDSTGKMTSISRSPYQKKICSVELDDKSLSELGERIKAIPEALPSGAYIQYLDHCEDEREHHISVTIGESQRKYSYSQPERCRDSEVPKWLLSMYAEFERHSKTIEECRAKP